MKFLHIILFFSSIAAFNKSIAQESNCKIMDVNLISEGLNTFVSIYLTDTIGLSQTSVALGMNEDSVYTQQYEFNSISELIQAGAEFINSTLKIPVFDLTFSQEIYATINIGLINGQRRLIRKKVN